MVQLISHPASKPRVDQRVVLTVPERLARSELPGLNDLDLVLVQACVLVGETDTGDAIRRF